MSGLSNPEYYSLGDTMIPTFLHDRIHIAWAAVWSWILQAGQPAIHPIKAFIFAAAVIVATVAVVVAIAYIGMYLSRGVRKLLGADNVIPSMFGTHDPPSPPANSTQEQGNARDNYVHNIKKDMTGMLNLAKMTNADVAQLRREFNELRQKTAEQRDDFLTLCTAMKGIAVNWTEAFVILNTNTDEKIRQMVVDLTQLIADPTLAKQKSPKRRRAAKKPKG
jgi:hypothetical protein